MGGTWATRDLSTRFLYADDVRHVPAGDNHQETSVLEIFDYLAENHISQ